MLKSNQTKDSRDQERPILQPTLMKDTIPRCTIEKETRIQSKNCPKRGKEEKINLISLEESKKAGDED